MISMERYSLVYLFIGAAITKNHKQGGLNREVYCLKILGAKSPSLFQQN